MSNPDSEDRRQNSRARRQIEVAPPTFILMTEDQQDQAVRVLTVVLLPMIRDRQPDPADRMQNTVTHTIKSADHRARQPARTRARRQGDAST